MRRSPWIAVLLACFGLAAEASDGLDLSAKSRAAASTTPARSYQAPFANSRDPMPEMMLREEQASRGPRGACQATARDLCYDLSDRRIVFRPARRYMPKMEGLTADSVSVNRNRIVLRYTFR